jgi:hypothetical protein
MERQRPRIRSLRPGYPTILDSKPTTEAMRDRVILERIEHPVG